MSGVRLHIPPGTWQRILLLSAALTVCLALATVDFHSLQTPLQNLVLTLPRDFSSPSSNASVAATLDADEAVQIDPLWALMDDIQRHLTKYAIGVLMVDEDLVTFNWMADERLNDTTVFLIHDDEDFNSLKEVSSTMYGVSISASASKAAGFHGANFMARPSPSAWDKALYFFCRLSPKYEVVWLMENDVYIPSIEALISTLRLPESSDLVVKEHLSNKEQPGWHNWEHANLQLTDPLYKSMVCAVGLSKTLVTEIDTYVGKARKLGFVETFFNSIAAHGNLTVLHPPSLETLQWKHSWTCDDVRNSNMSWFHPVKDQENFVAECDFSYGSTETI